MSIIHLPESLASRIAAGEVVDRPASVVKELVENALDAQAKEISVWVEGSGVSLIRVSDDGAGIAPSDLVLAVDRHSTSKLKSEADLFRIATLGFRGEALPSIGSVAKLEIVTRIREETLGYRLRVEGGKKGDPVMAGCPAGTTVEVRDLFYNTPARRKFLKSPATELSHVCDVVNRLALAYGGVHFRLYRGETLVSDYVAVSSLQDRLAQVLGSEIASAMAFFSAEETRKKFSGFLSTAPSSFSSSRYLLTYVNRRYVRDRLLSHAILQGYETLLMKGRYPAVVLFLEVPFEDVDVNVHPAKYEVRFRRQSEIHDAVAGAVQEGLKAEAKGMQVKAPAQTAGSVFEVRELTFPYHSSSRAEGFALNPSGSMRSGTEEQERVQGFFSGLDILGQILGCYLVCASPRGMVLIDQHAAHERIAFEEMRHALGRGEVQRQSLLLPQVLEFSVAEGALLEQNLPLLDSLGFSVEVFGSSGFTIRAVPALLAPGDYRGAMRSMVAELAEVGKSAELRQGLEERLMTIACHSVVRANRRLELEEIRSLLHALDRVDFATQCPHGRPVVIELSQDQLERMFKRT
ncbi:MAG: DNA mismatch repair endonuclease MutL [Deltaproteobacteria bacterium]|nr:DNA mismatch repair endonuclease MutL [Deltaproteobacteria bacterium]